MKLSGLLALGALGAGALVVASCGKTQNISIVLQDLCGASEGGFSFSTGSATTEIAVFPGTCPSLDTFNAGDTSTATFHAIVPSSGSLPEIGSLSKEPHGFGVIVRDENCAVIAFGCTPADLSNGDLSNIEIPVFAYAGGLSCDPKLGIDPPCCSPLQNPGCEAPLSCVQGRCLAEGGSEGGSEGGTGCDLTVVASGPLPDPIVSLGKVTGPAVVATPSGFVLAYREQNIATKAGTARLLLLTPDGVLGAAHDVSVGSCSVDQPDAVGLAFNGSKGVLAAALPDCQQGGAGAQFVTFDASGKPGGGTAPRNPAFADLLIGQSHGLSSVGTAGEFEFVYRAAFPGDGGLTPYQAQVARLAGPTFKGGLIPTVAFGGKTTDFAVVASTGTVRGTLGHLPDDGITVLELGTPATDFTPPAGILQLPPAAWGAVTAFSDRVAVIVPGAVSAGPAPDAGEGGTEAGASEGGTSVGTGFTLQIGDATAADRGKLVLGSDYTFTGGDVALAGDDLIVIGAIPGRFLAFRVAGARSALPTVAPTGREYDGTQPLTGVDGHRFAIAAGSGRIAVVWLAKHDLGSSGTGGWALLQCAP